MITKTKAAPKKRKPLARVLAEITDAQSAAAVLGIPESQVTYMLRTCDARRQAYYGFQWPESGLVICPDWKKTAACGNGLHGLLHGDGDNSLLNWNEDATWLVVAIDRSEFVEIERKVKVPRGVVETCPYRSVYRGECLK